MIIVDERMGSKDLIPYLPPEITKKMRLEAGDVAFFGHGPDGPFTFPVGIEHKTVGDAINSFQTKRFVGEQYPKMADLYRRIYFMIEGEYREGPDGKLVVPDWSTGKLKWVSHGWQTTFRQFDNWQNSLTETGKVIFKRSLNKSESACQIVDLFYMWTKDYSTHSSLFAFDKSQQPPQISKPTLTRLIAAQIPGIGWELSKRADDTFASPINLVNATEEQWQKVPGIGPQKAKKIVSVLKN